MKRVTLGALAIVGALGLVGCDPGPTCAEYSTTLQPVTTYVNGKPSFSMVPVTVCVRYEAETNDPPQG